MATWISVDADWISGDWQTYGRTCDGCSWASRCGAGLFDRTKRGTRRPKSKAYNMSKRRDQILAMMTKVGIVRAVMRDCHASICGFLYAGDVAYHIDNHPDDRCYDPTNAEYSLHCGNWRSCVEARGVQTISATPSEVSRSGLRDAALFVCLSRPYTPRRVDLHVFRLLEALPCQVDFDLTR